MNSEEDVRRVRKLVAGGSQRRGLMWLVPDILTGEVHRIQPFAEGGLDAYEGWEVEGEPGVTTLDGRRAYLRDGLLGEPVGREELYEVRGIDVEGCEVALHLSDQSVSLLKRSVARLQEDPSCPAEILSIRLYAEPISLASALVRTIRQR